MVKNSPSNEGDIGSIPGLGRSPGEGISNQCQYSSLENPMERGAWRATIHGATKSQTRLSIETDRPRLCWEQRGTIHTHVNIHTELLPPEE